MHLFTTVTASSVVKSTCCVIIRYIRHIGNDRSTLLLYMPKKRVYSDSNIKTLQMTMQCLVTQGGKLTGKRKFWVELNLYH